MTEHKKYSYRPKGRMKILGLTGSIAMGKSTAAAMLEGFGIPMHDSDATVHQLFAPGGPAVSPIEAAFPGVTGPKGVDRAALGQKVFNDKAALKRLEAIVHPLVRAEEQAFLRRNRQAGQPLVCLNVPLLLETGHQARCDYIAVVTAPAFIQRQRVMARPGMTAEKMRGILARQMPDVEKRRRADFVIPTGLGKAVTRRALKRMLKQILSLKNTSNEKA